MRRDMCKYDSWALLNLWNVKKILSFCTYSNSDHSKSSTCFQLASVHLIVKHLFANMWQGTIINNHSQFAWMVGWLVGWLFGVTNIVEINRHMHNVSNAYDQILLTQARCFVKMCYGLLQHFARVCQEPIEIFDITIDMSNTKKDRFCREQTHYWTVQFEHQ